MKDYLTTRDPGASRLCFFCGESNASGLKLKFFRHEDNAIAAEVDPPPDWCGWEGILHGGFQSALLDEAVSWAASALGGQPYFLTIEMTTKYRRPVRTAQTLSLVGRILKETGRGCVAQGQILNREGQVLSEAEAKVMYVDRERFLKIIESAP